MQNPPRVPVSALLHDRMMPFSQEPLSFVSSLVVADCQLSTKVALAITGEQRRVKGAEAGGIRRHHDHGRVVVD